MLRSHPAPVLLDHKESRVSKESKVIVVQLVLLAPLALAAAAVLTVLTEEWVHQVRRERREYRERLARRVHPAGLGPRAVLEPRDRLAAGALQDRSEPLVTGDHRVR